MATTYQDFLNIVNYAVKGNSEAVNFITDACEAIHFWDDLIDKDKPISDNAIDDIMDALFFRLPANQFYRNNEHLLRPIMMASIYNWQAATKMEREPKNTNDLHIAFILRSCYADLLGICAVIFHGRKNAINIICEIRRFWHSEGFDTYIKNLVDEKAKRGV